jgi:hypothetical protein
MTVACPLTALFSPAVWLTFVANRGRWFFGPRHGFGVGGLLAVLFAILLIFLCVHLLVSDNKTR